MAMVPQGAMNSLNPVRRVRDHFADSIRAHRTRVGDREIRERMQELLGMVGLRRSVGDLYPNELSGGMKQRVCIALAITLEPKVIIADEPTSALDVVMQRQVMQTLRTIQERLGASVLLIGHDMGLLAQFVDRLGIMFGGRLVEVGPVRDLFHNPIHPYTRMVIESLPTLEGARPLASSPGERRPAAAVAHGGAAGGGARSLGGGRGEGKLTALLEAHDLTQTFGSGSRADRRARAPDAVHHRGDPLLYGDRRRVGEREDHARPLAAGVPTPDVGRGPVSRPGPLPGRGRTEMLRFRREVQAIFQDPFEVYNPFYRIDHLLTTPIKKFHLAVFRQGGAGDGRAVPCTRSACSRRRRSDAYPHQLSGGQRQRVTVARALLIQPKLVIADEPVSMIDASLRATVLESLRRLFNDFGISFIYITHDLTTAYQVSDNVFVLYRGRIAEAGDVEHVIKQPEHPYTQLLVNSIPVADPDQQWGEDIPVVESGGPEADRSHACAFVSRCPKAMPPLHPGGAAAVPDVAASGRLLLPL